MGTVPAGEDAVGMTEYVSDTPGIGGQLKTVPEDFIVTELETFEYEPVTADAAAYPHVVLRVKLTDRETNAFATTLANRLGVSRTRIAWAGTKDKRAITTQLMTVAGGSPEAVAAVSIAGADIEVVGRAGRQIRFGDLAGNAFEITVRDVETPGAAEDTTAALRRLGDGTATVPNYFGVQRFGSRRPITHRVGDAILAGDWETALHRYVCTTAPTEPADTSEARSAAAAALAENDYQAALTALPERLHYERTLLHARIDGASPQAAFDRLPENLRQLFVHAVQSALFNRIVSRRLTGTLSLVEPAVGDIVCFADADREYGFPVPDPDRAQTVAAERVSAFARHCSRHRAFVTGPLIGTDTTFATAEPGAIERDVLEAAGLSRDSFAMSAEWHTAGTRRALTVPISPTVTADDGKVTIEFALPKGAYATVVLREYMKAPLLAYV